MARQVQPSPPSVLEDAAFLGEVLASVPLFVARLDEASCIRYVNRLQPGFELEQVLGRPVTDFVPPEARALHIETIERVRRTGQPEHFGTTGAGPEGRVAHYESHVVPIRSTQGPLEICLIAVEVTEHVHRSVELEASEQKLRIGVEAAGVALWSWDHAEHRVEWNQRAHEVTGLEDPIGPRAYLARLIHAADRDRLASHYEREGDFGQQLHRIVRADGQTRWIMPTGSAVVPGTEPRRVAGFLDVTEQRQVEEHLRQSQKISAIGELTAGVAHNFNNMLAVILPALDLVRLDASPVQREILDDAIEAARRASELITQLMTFAGQRRELAREVTELAPIVENAVAMCKRTFDRKLQVELRIEDRSMLVEASRTGLEQVLLNLLINARDAVSEVSGEDARISVEVAVAEGELPSESRPGSAHFARIRVQDNGAGMSEATRQRLFEPFFTTKEPGRGTGLGLATSYAIVREHGGHISCESQLGEGSVFTVRIPITDRAERPADKAEPEHRATRPGRILIVDDEAGVRRMAERVMRLQGLQTRTATDGPDGLAVVRSGFHPDVVLLDRSMPGPPVVEIVAALRGLIPEAKIIYFTGQEVPADERERVDGVVSKPLSARCLVAEISQWMPPR